jgi:hypothetical protein
VLPDGVAIFLNENAIFLGDFVGNVRNQGEVDLTKTSLLAWGLYPCKVNELRVNRASQYLYTCLSELLSLDAELNDLSGAHEGEVYSSVNIR